MQGTHGTPHRFRTRFHTRRGRGLVWTRGRGISLCVDCPLFSKRVLKGKLWAPGDITCPAHEAGAQVGGWEILGCDSILAAAEHAVQRGGVPCQRARARPSPGEWATTRSPRSPRAPCAPVEPWGLEAPAHPRRLQGPRPPRVARGFLVRRRLTRAPRALVTRVTPCPALPSGPPSVFVLGFLCLYF